MQSTNPTGAWRHPAVATLTPLVLVFAVGGCERGMRESPTAASPPSAETAEPPLPPSHSGITAEANAGILPGPPGSVDVTHLKGSHRVVWRGTGDDQVARYRVYRRCPGSEWVELGSVALHTDDERNRGTYEFEEVFDDDCDYTVAAVDRSGVIGQKTVDIQ